MEISPVIQARLALICFLSGVSLGVFYDFVRSLGYALSRKLADRIFAYEGQGSISIEGEYKMGTKFWEFYAYEESIEKILKEVFYEKAN